MLRQGLSRRVRKPLNATIGISAFAVTTLSALLKVTPDDVGNPIVLSVVTFSHRSSWWVIPISLIIGLIAQYARSNVGSPDVWELVQYILDRYRDEMFEKNNETNEDPQHFHRVTLYKSTRWRWAFVRWPGSEWVVPVARSGSTTKTKIPCFRSSRNNPNAAEGVVGQTWARVNRRVPAFELPDLNMEHPNEADVETYARRTFVSVEWVKWQIKKQQRGPQARALLGIPVEAKGNSWGVLVVDSRSPQPIQLNKVFKSPGFQAHSDLLSRLLEKV